MIGAGALGRAHDRSATITWRLSPEDRAAVREAAASHGLSVQSYLEWQILGRKVPSRRPDGPTRRDQELPMTG